MQGFFRYNWGPELLYLKPGILSEWHSYASLAAESLFLLGAEGEIRDSKVGKIGHLKVDGAIGQCMQAASSSWEKPPAIR